MGDFKPLARELLEGPIWGKLLGPMLVKGYSAETVIAAMNAANGFADLARDGGQRAKLYHEIIERLFNEAEMPMVIEPVFRTRLVETSDKSS